MKRYLFLDIDGVLNSAQSAIMYAREWNNKGRPQGRSLLSKNNWEFCPIAVSNLQFIFEKIPDLKVVISSTWRYGETLQYFKDMFKTLNLPEDSVISMTPRLNGPPRGLEIQQWLDENEFQYSLMDPEYEFVIVDDDSDMEHLKTNLVQTNYRTGLTLVEANEIIKRFNSQGDEDEN